MKKVLLMASLLALSSAVNATLPSSIMQRPAGFKDPLVEGVRVQPAQGCTWNEFKNELIANKTNANWPYSIERYHNTPTAGSKYAVVFSAKDQTISVTWTPDADLGPTIPELTTYQTTSDAGRLNRLKTLQKADRNASPYNNFTKSKVYRRELNALYTSKFNDATTCVDYQGLEYKWSMATADPTQFVKSNTNWAEYKQAYGLTQTERSPDRLGTMVIVDGTVNLNGIQDPSRFEVITTDDLDGKTFVKQAYSEEYLALPTTPPEDRLLSTVNDNTIQHANVMGNLATALSKANVVVLPTAAGGNLTMYSADTPKLNNATTDSLEKAVKYIDRHYLDLNASVVVITADVPPEGNLREFYNTLDNLRDKNINIIMSAGNDGIHEAADEGSTYPPLGGTFHVVNGSPVTTVGVVGPTGDLVSNYGNDIQSVLRIKPEAKTIENYGPGNITSSVDVSLSELDLMAGATGGSSYAAVIVGSLAVDIKAKFPWLSSDEFKTGLVEGLYENRPEPPFAASEAELELFNKKWEKVNGGIFDAKMLADYLKATYGKYRATYVGYITIKDPNTPWTWESPGNPQLGNQAPSPEALCQIANGVYSTPASLGPFTYRMTPTATPNTLNIEGYCHIDRGVNNVNGTITVPYRAYNNGSAYYYSDSWDDLLAKANNPDSSLTHGKYQWYKDESHTYGWWSTIYNWPGTAVIQANYPLNPAWKCDWKNNYGGTLISVPNGTAPDAQRYCSIPE